MEQGNAKVFEYNGQKLKSSARVDLSRKPQTEEMQFKYFFLYNGTRIKYIHEKLKNLAKFIIGYIVKGKRNLHILTKKQGIPQTLSM